MSGRENAAAIIDRISIAILTAPENDLRKVGEILSSFEELGALAEKEGWTDVPEAVRLADSILSGLMFREEMRGKRAEAMDLLGRLAAHCRENSRSGKGSPAGLSVIRKEIVDRLALDVGPESGGAGGPVSAEGEAPASVRLDQDRELYTDFVTESMAHLQEIEVKMVDLESSPTDREIINAIFRGFHTIKGVSGFLNLKDVNELSHRTETLLDLARRGSLEVTSSVIDVVFEAIDAIKGMVGEVGGKIAAGEESRVLWDTVALCSRIEGAQTGNAPGVEEAGKPLLGDLLVEQGKIGRQSIEDTVRGQKENSDGRPIGKILIEEKKVTPRDVAQALRVQRGGAAAAEAQDIRVDVRKLDGLVDMVGELVIAQSQVANDLDRTIFENQRLCRNMSQLSRITSELQKIGMSMRMVPIRGTFQKMSRIVRDLARKSGKEVVLRMEGEETEVDRNMVEEIHDPLVHLIRNSVDHGLELPSTRAEAGKNPCGCVTLRAYHLGGNVVIEVEDDGRGLNPGKILAKAKERGLAPAEAAMPEQEIFALVFEPGFSTAEKITDVSGRGVGLDVVRRNVEKLRGTVDVRSQAGKGAVFLMKLPLTLAIIDGIIVRIGSQRYVMPASIVVESLRPARNEYFTVEGRGEMIRVRGEILPLVRLHRIFSVPDGTTDPFSALAVVVEREGERRAFVVDELLGKQEVVIKSLGSGMTGIPGISGGAIMGDGRVGLILDVAGIFDLTGRSAACA